MTYSEDEQICKKLSYYKTKPTAICNKTNKQKNQTENSSNWKTLAAQDDTDDVLK